jgi:carnitine O-acetyltransferase
MSCLGEFVAHFICFIRFVIFAPSVAVLCKNQFYYFRALWPESWDVAVDEDDINDILRAIRKHADQMSVEESSQHGLGILSSLPRSRWAKAREVLCQSVQNAAALNIIDSALFVLVLDDFSPNDVHETAANMLHGTNRLADGDTYQVGSCLNRWYDKLQLIVCEDGTAGCNFEHSGVDGHTALRFVSDIFSETVISFADSIVDLIHGRGRIQHVVGATVTRAAKSMATGELEWDVFPRKIGFELS